VPTDDAFKAFAAQKPALFKAVSENPAMLKKLLANHIVSGLLARKDIKDNQVVRSMAEETVRFNVYGAGDKQVTAINKSFEHSFSCGCRCFITHIDAQSFKITAVLPKVL
jgi:uncharacterized surface protein with fasciclin (FAS1) repeats